MTPSFWCTSSAIYLHSLGQPQIAARLPLQSEPHPLIVSRVANSTLVSTINQRVSNVCTNVSSHLGGDLTVTIGCPADTGISILAISRGPEELAGVSRIIWLESDCSTDMIYHIHNIPSQSKRANRRFITNTICGMMEYVGYRNPLPFNTPVRVNR